MANKPPFPPDQLPVEMVERRIHLIRGQKVMLDSDLAGLYQVEPRALIQAVKRNRDRFPEDFMFQLSTDETAAMRSQFVTASKRNIRYQPYAFTEHGALMLSSVLKSKRAVQMSIRVVRVFIRLREMLATHKDLATRMEKLEAGQIGPGGRRERVQGRPARIRSSTLAPGPHLERDGHSANIGNNPASDWQGSRMGHGARNHFDVVLGSAGGSSRGWTRSSATGPRHSCPAWRRSRRRQSFRCAIGRAAIAECSAPQGRFCGL